VSSCSADHPWVKTCAELRKDFTCSHHSFHSACMNCMIVDRYEHPLSVERAHLYRKVRCMLPMAVWTTCMKYGRQGAQYNQSTCCTLRAPAPNNQTACQVQITTFIILNSSATYHHCAICVHIREIKKKWPGGNVRTMVKL
jgi:hypothetical protein